MVNEHRKNIEAKTKEPTRKCQKGTVDTKNRWYIANEHILAPHY